MPDLKQTLSSLARPRRTHDEPPAPLPWSGNSLSVVVKGLAVLPTPSLPRVVADAVATVGALASAVAPDPSGAPPGAAPASASPTSPEERAAWLVGLRQIVDQAEAAFTAVLADFDSAGDGQVLHAAASTQAWLRGALGMASAEAAERVRTSRATRTELAPAHQAQLSGNVTHEQVRTIARCVRALPPSFRDEAARHLTGLAAQLGGDDLRAAARHLKLVVDPDGSARHAEEDFGRRWLSIAPLLDGMASLTGVLDAETAGALHAALSPALVPTGPEDTRTSDQRRADGLAELVAIAVRSGELSILSGTPASLQVEVPLATLTGDSVQPGRLTHTSGPVWLTPTAVERLACDASVRRLVFDGDGVPLDLGREVRVFSTVQRRALAHRDGGCRFPGCHRPAAFTDAHHVVPWARGGATDLPNGLLLCRHHHRQVHEGGWTITPDNSSRGTHGPCLFAGPAGQSLISTPRAGPAP